MSSTRAERRAAARRRSRAAAAPEPAGAPPADSLRSRLADAGALALLAALVLFHRLGAASLLGDETIYAQVERQAAFKGQWMPPHYLGKVFFAKPPLRNWVVAVLFRLFGVSEWTARGLDAAMGVATLVLVYLAGRSLFGRRAGAVAALLLLGAHNLVFLHGLREGVQESALLLTLSAALLSYLLAATAAAPLFAGGAVPPEGAATPGGAANGAMSNAVSGVEADAGRRRDRADVVAGLWTVTSLLVKNAMGLLVLGVTGLFELLFARGPASRGWRRLLPRHPLRILGVVLAVYVPWLGIAYLGSHGEYFAILHTDVIQRLSGGIDPRHVRRGVFARELLDDFGPSLGLAALAPLFALAGLATSRRLQRVGRRRVATATPAPPPVELERVTFLVLWAGLVLAVLSLSAEKLEWYIYPAYPAIALLVGCGADRALAWLERSRLASWAGLAALAGAAVVTVYLGARVLHAWEEGGLPPRRIDADQLARQIEAAGRPLVCLDPKLALREWNIFYLIPHVTRFAWTPVDAARCDVLMTDKPARFVPAAFPRDRLFLFHKFDRTEQDTYVIDLAGKLHLGEVATP